MNTENEKSQTGLYAFLVSLACAYFFLDPRAVKGAKSDWPLLVTTLIIAVIFNTLTSFSLAFTLGSLNDLDWRAMVFIAMIFLTVLWATDYAMCHVFWSPSSEKKSFSNWFLVVVRVLGVVACGCITIPFWATYAEPIQYKNYVNQLNLAKKTQLNQSYDDEVEKLRLQYITPYDLKIKKAFDERENLSLKLETHKDQFLMAKDELGRAVQEKNYQLKGQENPSKNGRGPKFVQAESAETAAKLKSDALEKLIISDEQALAMVNGQLELLNAERDVATKEFNRLKAELSDRQQDYIPLGYGDLNSKLDYLFASFKHNPLKLTFPLGIMFLVLLFDSYSICSITCFKPKLYTSLLEIFHDNDKIISETKILITHYKVMQELNVTSHEAEILASEENHRFFKDLGDVSNLSLSGFNLIAKEKAAKKTRPGPEGAPTEALQGSGNGERPVSQITSPDPGGAPWEAIQTSANGVLPPREIPSPGPGALPPKGYSGSGNGALPPMEYSASGNGVKPPMEYSGSGNGVKPPMGFSNSDNGGAPPIKF
jgi:hypothetical protein